ncbi:cAMP-binding domain of CRP or a regulatory subunit of cAMP-dependent protein kinases [Lishizhenia tianjinensis]|uniref:cAMP-binding domain of CRP or a regulatory subunit of cAMP-dependent protein kinases n=1 Tax=Lishizhenia tianjinensis TaxID=477690 RepID=A0A1I7A1X5_9FLAO|nr:Crp/Fnr family transcriptional regulator [Lishizhenia tianjinensis]SFT68929.1 cAMP-binding domain of CRP or a regulatory subunit of cAMP-dependent protein kinases [Lishizhenia tianjinensis]
MQNLSTQLKKAFDAYFEAPIEAWEEFAAHCEPMIHRKDEVLKKQGNSEKYFYFIEKGSVGVFLWKENNFVCLDFAFDGQFCCDYMSVLTEEPNDLELVALETTKVHRMTVENFRKLGDKSIGQILMRKSAESSFVDKQKQQIDLLTKSSEERYRELCQRFPKVELRVAQKHIASYLGITPQSLSRLRRKHA